MTTGLVTIDATTASVHAVIAGAALADSTKRKYQRAVERYQSAGGHLLDASALSAYATALGASQRAQLKAAVKLYSEAMLEGLKAHADPENVAFVQAAEYRTQALQQAIKVKQPKGVKTHTWLTRAQVMALLDTCDTSTLKGERDRLALGLLVAAGLRRAEAVGLEFGDLVLQPVKGKMRTVLAVHGKGAKDRSVPVSESLAAAIEHWGRHVRREGRVLRSIDQRGDLRESLSTVAVFQIVHSAGAKIGKPELAPHDLRRTYAQLGLEAGVSITQISRLLGHASVATTQRYLCLDLDLDTTISDFIPF